MIEIQNTNNIAKAQVSTPINKASISTNNDPTDALYNEIKNIAENAQISANSASEALEEIQTKIAETYTYITSEKEDITDYIQEQKETISSNINLKKESVINEINEAGESIKESLETISNEINELNPADKDLSNITTDGTNVIKNTISSDLSNINTTLENKVNKSDLKAYIIEAYQNGNSGYNIYSNGYCKQWGRLGGSTNSITYLKKFANTNYVFQSTYIGATGKSGTGYPSSLSATGASINSATISVSWQACGYIS